MKVFWRQGDEGRLPAVFFVGCDGFLDYESRHDCDNDNDDDERRKSRQLGPDSQRMTLEQSHHHQDQ